MFKVGDKVVVIEEEPDVNERDRGVPVGTTGEIVSIGDEFTHPIYGDLQQLYDVLLDLQYNEQAFCEDHGGQAQATMYESMIALQGSDDVSLDLGALDDFLKGETE